MERTNLHYLVWYRNEKGDQVANWHETLSSAVSFAKYLQANGIAVYRIEEKRIIKGWEAEGGETDAAGNN